MTTTKPERDLEEALVSKLKDLKYEYRPDICDRATLERNFREKFESLNRVNLTESEFQRLTHASEDVLDRVDVDEIEIEERQ